MIEIGIVIGVVMAIGVWLKKETWFPTKFIPLAIIFLAVLFNVLDAWLFNGDLREAGKTAFIEALSAIGIHSGTKNMIEGANSDDTH
jgi:hypothetical protein